MAAYSVLSVRIAIVYGIGKAKVPRQCGSIVRIFNVFGILFVPRSVLVKIVGLSKKVIVPSPAGGHIVVFVLILILFLGPFSKGFATDGVAYIGPCRSKPEKAAPIVYVKSIDTGPVIVYGIRVQTGTKVNGHFIVQDIGPPCNVQGAQF